MPNTFWENSPGVKKTGTRPSPDFPLPRSLILILPKPTWAGELA